MTKVIKAEGLSKAYQLGDFGTGTISRDLERFWARMRGKEDPFLKIGETNDRTTKSESDIVWSLKDINFEIEQGDAVGIIGRNGAGKSTLLKVLSRVTSPTTGSVKVKGRIASLLEVGTGFHPELTGRENIFLNGAILGMRKAEIKRKFDEIVAFAGVERYIDTPVKRYSSGMYVRLAFAVAAHLESEILIVDEVLAVGDAEFQKKCLGKMGDISKGEGRTVLFVSHNMGAVSQLCRSGIVLKDGMINYIGGTAGALESYLSTNGALKQAVYDAPGSLNKKIHISSIRFKNNNRESNIFLFNEQIGVIFCIANLNLQSSDITMTIIVKNNQSVPIFSTHRVLDNNTSKDDELRLTIPRETLLPGKYLVDIILHRPHIEFIEKIIDILEFVVEDSGNANSIYENEDLGDVNVNVQWGN
jgi:lipopolysaccharide transport system ATP-binding protein